MSCLNSGWDGNFVSNVNSNGQANTQETCPGFDCIYITGYNNNWENHEGYYSPSMYIDINFFVRAPVRSNRFGASIPNESFHDDPDPELCQ